MAHARLRRVCAAATALFVLVLARRASAQDAAPTFEARLAPSSALDPAYRDRPVAEEEPSEEEGPMGPFRLGVVAGVGAPSLIGFGITTKLTPYFGAGANLGLIPSVQIPVYGQATISYQEYDAYLRAYPFGGGFFLGAGIGYENAHGTFSTTGTVPAIQGISPAQDVTVTSEANVRSLIFIPQIGYLHRYGSGILLGIDVGAQIPIDSTDVTLSTNLPPGVPSEVAAPAIDEVRSSLQKIGKQVIPTLNLRVGYML